MRLLPSIACALVCAAPRAASPADSTAGGDASGIDEVYTAFSAGYARLDPAAVGALYSEDALYLGADNDILRGRSAIEASLRSYFDGIRERRGTLAIEFQVVQRSVSGGQAVDVGYYRVTSTQRDGPRRTMYGKFLVVLQRGADGRWRFSADGNSAAPAGAVEQAFGAISL